MSTDARHLPMVLSPPRPERYAVDAAYPDVFYVPENADFLVREGRVRWPFGGGTHELVLRPGDTYVLPWGTKIRIEKQPGGTAWQRPDWQNSPYAHWLLSLHEARCSQRPF